MSTPAPALLPLPSKIWPSSKGDLVLTTPGDVVEDYDVHARIVAKVPGCGTRGVIVRGLDSGAPFPSTLIVNQGPAVISAGSPFTCIDTLGVPTVPSAKWQGLIGYHDYVVRQCEGYWLVDGYAAFNLDGPLLAVDIEGLYIHSHFWGKDSGQPNGFVHGDGGQIQGCKSSPGSGFRLVGSLMTGLNDQGKFPGAPKQANSSLMASPNVGPVTGLDVHDNTLGGGLFATVNFANKGKPTNWGRVYGNIFTGDSADGYEIGHHPGDTLDLTGSTAGVNRPNLRANGAAIRVYVGK